MPKRKKESAEEIANKKAKEETVAKERLDPKQRGIHKDGIQVGKAPTSRSTCVDCNKAIAKDAPRWGIKYGGNPLPEAVIPLYGTNPMVMWCHAGGCGLLYQRWDDLKDLPEAARVCHLCSDSIDEETEKLRLACGGNTKGKKIQRHAFHMACWKKAIVDADVEEEVKTAVLISPESIGLTRKNKKKPETLLTWEDLTEQEKEIAKKALKKDES